MIGKILSDGSALFLFWLFVSAGVGKLKPANRQYYLDLATEYVGTSLLLRYAVLLLGGIEVVSGLLVVVPATRLVGMACILGLLVAYLALMAYQLYQGKVDMDCGCAGPGANIKIGAESLARNVILGGIAGLCMLPAVGDLLSTISLSLALAIFMTLTYSSAEKAVSNFQKIKLLKAN
ncbi:MauE/DoxX family redox-associated membrane protein [Photobacterium rosenbergii]|uniref:Methylamine utilization protein MauE n=1 Tax=Photobacterium rosenbergii TaxID=294936 RepID=A0ABU3ZJA2_9GAMM|nr:MauE/DoxX family redox-associated membrane protein [Photobacterium rosenbergii]MDV5170191.1 MauE/DoxX family redox-associated membrane protein [Photobacterium rosenbergii]